MLEDLGSLSGGRAGRPVLPDEQRRLAGGRAWAWLQPWAWISGLAWSAGESSKSAKLMLQVFGEGLHNARTIQVLAARAPGRQGSSKLHAVGDFVRGPGCPGGWASVHPLAWEWLSVRS